jgi:cell division protein FtsB
VTVAAVAFLLLLLGVAGARSWRDLDRARDRQADLELEIEQTEERIETLERRIQRLRRDPLLLERLAREELNLVREGEVVFMLPEPAGAPPGPGSP